MTTKSPKGFEPHFAHPFRCTRIEAGLYLIENVRADAQVCFLNACDTDTAHFITELLSAAYGLDDADAIAALNAKKAILVYKKASEEAASKNTGGEIFIRSWLALGFSLPLIHAIKKIPGEEYPPLYYHQGVTYRNIGDFNNGSCVVYERVDL